MSHPLPWDVVTSTVSTELDKKTKQLEQVKPDDLARLQGEIAMLRWVLDLPVKVTRDRVAAADAIDPGY